MILKAFVLTPGAKWFFQRYRWIIFAVERINLFPLDTVAISVPNTYPLVSRFIRLIAAFERLGPDVWRYWVRALKEGNLEKRINFLDFPLLYLIDVTVAGTSMHSLLYGLMPQDWTSKFLSSYKTIGRGESLLKITAWLLLLRNPLITEPDFF